jgi:hypothetical protein
MNTNEIICAISNDNFLKKLVTGVYSRDRIPVGRKTYPCAYIINTDFSHSSGKHWLAIYFINKTHAEFFDSFGHNLEYYGLGHLGRGLNVLFFRKSIQHEKSLLCGYYCLYFLYMKRENYSFKHFYDIFTENKTENDCIVFNFVISTFDMCNINTTYISCIKDGIRN